MSEFMPYIPSAQAHYNRPLLTSFDSGEECSLAHWIEVCKLVDAADMEAEKDLELSQELEEAIAETALSVDSETAYQPFASNVA